MSIHTKLIEGIPIIILLSIVFNIDNICNGKIFLIHALIIIVYLTKRYIQ